MACFPFLILSCILFFDQYFWPPFSSLSLVSQSWYKRQHEGFVLIPVFVLIFLRYIQQLFLLILHFTRCRFPLLSWKRRVFRSAQFLVVFHWCVVGTGCACLYCWQEKQHTVKLCVFILFLKQNLPSSSAVTAEVPFISSRSFCLTLAELLSLCYKMHRNTLLCSVSLNSYWYNVALNSTALYCLPRPLSCSNRRFVL